MDDGGNEVGSEASDDSHSRHQSTPHRCLASITVSIHQAKSAARVFCLCTCPFLILPFLLCLHLCVLHLSIAQPYPNLFVISAHPYVPHPSLISFLPLSINSALLCVLSSRLYPSVSLSLHLSICHPFAASNHPITSPSPLVRMYFSLLSVGLTVHCQTTEDTLVAPCCHCLRVGSLDLFLILSVPEPPCDRSFSASSSLWPPMSPCTHLLPCHHTCDVLISPAAVAAAVRDARSHYCISAPPSVNETLSRVALDPRRVFPRQNESKVAHMRTHARSLPLVAVASVLQTPNSARCKCVVNALWHSGGSSSTGSENEAIFKRTGAVAAQLGEALALTACF